MNWSDDSYYNALKARDPRFDGLFFVGVTSTGIYCRPICPARTPLKKNCTFFASSAGAAQAGFRPCLRCRPEMAPGRAPVDTVSRLARTAAGRLHEAESMAQLARSLGVGERQLRRAFKREYGVTPSKFRVQRRLELARQLLRETKLPVTEIAFASGFGSLRRFHAAFKTRFGSKPTERRQNSEGNGLTLRLSYRPPLHWDSLLAFLKPRLWRGVESIDGSSYRRTVGLGSAQGTIQVRPGANNLEVSVQGSLTPVIEEILSRVVRLFDLDCHPDLIYEHLQRHFPDFQRGLRVPGSFCNYELCLRAILGQQVSVKGASTLAARLVEKFGTAYSGGPHLTHLFPKPETLAQATTEQLANLGIPLKRADCLRGVSRAVAEGQLNLTPGLNPQTQLAELESLPGIGPWTAHYVAMRGLGWPDAFPDGDLGLLKASQLKRKELVERSRHWTPWRSYAAMHLWSKL